jgi:uncharacterized protein with LGFP repeats
MGLKSNLIFHHIIGAIRVRYDAMSCKPGLPSGGESTWKDLDGTARGKAQTFANGRLYLNADTSKVYFVTRVIMVHHDARRDVGHDLGMPTGDSISVTGGKVSSFENGRIYWSSKYSAREVHGAILAKYLATGGHKKWGFPTSDQLAAPGGASSRFQKARIYWSSAHGAHPVYGAILKKYLALGGGGSKLGLPISDEYGIKGGRRQDYEHGYIKWNSTTGKTTYKVT